MVDFDGLGVDTSSPGFYNDPNFITEERRNPNFLAEYNRFVFSKEYSQEYLESAKRKIDIIIPLLMRHAIRIEQEGLCIDLSQVMIKYLENQGLWCSTFGGSMTISYRNSPDYEPDYLWSYDSPMPQFAHVWIFAPPYKVIDLSLFSQSFNDERKELIPDYIAVEQVSDYEPEAIDIINLSLFNAHSRNGTLDEYFRTYPQNRELLNDIGAFQVVILNCELSYIPLNASASDGELEDIENISFSGMTPLDLYSREILEAVN